MTGQKAGGVTVKKLLKKNQIIIAVLAVMIAAAGYSNYSGRIFPAGNDTEEANADLQARNFWIFRKKT